MGYIVTAAEPSGKRSVMGLFDEPKKAIEKALESMGQGWGDVRIVSPKGDCYAPAEFADLFVSGLNRDA